jgi:hypothetical protein
MADQNGPPLQPTIASSNTVVEREIDKGHVNAISDANAKVVYWHCEFPPLDAEAIGEHTIEATSGHVPGTIAHRDDLWRVCYDDLMAQTLLRLEKEVTRLGGHYAHVFDETIDSRRDDAKGEAWLHARFAYELYRRPSTGENRSGNERAAPSAADRTGAGASG